MWRARELEQQSNVIKSKDWYVLRKYFVNNKTDFKLQKWNRKPSYKISEHRGQEMNYFMIWF